MSWFQKNYEKAALGGAAAVALGLAYMGWSKFSSVGNDFSAELTGSGNSATAVRDADLIPKALSSLKLERKWEQGADGDRPVDLFTGIPLFVGSASPEKPIDLLKDEPVHPPIPNTWWLTNRIDPGFADSPMRDPDQDGFSNQDEFNAKTDPNDPKSFPALIAKLMYLKDESLGWVIRPSFGQDGSFPFKYQDTKNNVNQTSGAEPVPPGGLFFAKGPMMNRFKLLGSEVRREMDPRVKIEKDNTYVRIEDQRPNKKGTVYELPSPMSEERRNEYLKWDRTAIFSLEALGLSGKEFKVEENMPFSLPPDSGKKDYLLKSVTPDAVEVEFTTPGGEKKSVSISKGSMPKISE